MSVKHLVTISGLVAMSLALSCKSTAQAPTDETTKPTRQIVPDDMPPDDASVPTVNILWDKTSERKLSHDVYFADYGRIHRMPNGNLILTYGCGADPRNTRTDVIVRLSSDNGLTWTAPKTIIRGADVAGYSGFANPEILIMKNGWIMLAYEGKGSPDDNDHANIQFVLSKDNGVTWDNPKIVAKGRAWEPNMVQFDDGDIQMFWSSEAKWWPSSDVQQEILLSRSTDNGATWSNPETVAYANGMRDGMPTPVILKDNKGIIFTIESIRDNRSPYVLWSSMSARWRYGSLGTAANGRRWLATTDNIFGAAPHLVQLNSGETLVSVQADDGRGTTDFHKQIMLLYRSNSMVKNARRISDPWTDLPVNQGAYYSMMFMKDPTRVVLVTTRSMADEHSEVWWKEGRLVHNFDKANWTIKGFSSEEPNNARLASKLIDGDIATFWITRYSTSPTDYPDHFITIDMGQSVGIDGISVVQKTTDRKVKTMEILTSTDNVTWQSQGTSTLQNKDVTEQLLPFAAKVTCRYFKLVPKSGYDAQKQPGLAEVGAYKLD